MWKWMFTKVIKMREKVALDLGGEDQEKPFLEHLEDLRVMLIRMALTLTIFAVGMFVFYHYLWSVIQFPVKLAGLEGKIKFIALEPMGPFMSMMNMSIAAGIVMASPLLLYFLLQFILPGLHNNEKKVIFPALGVGAGLFFCGAAFAYFVVAPKALNFFYHFTMSLSADLAPKDEVMPWGISAYVKFICQFVLLFGLCFELPVVVMALVKLDILSYKVMKGSRSWAAIAIVAVSAVIAPSPDPQTLLLIAGPLYCLYEICIWLAWYLNRRDRQLYPEYYKEKEEDEKAMIDAPEWDNESYNPWSDDSADDEEKPAPRIPPAGTQPMSDPHALAETASTSEHTEHSDAPSSDSPAETAPLTSRPFTLWTEETPEPPTEPTPPAARPFTLWTEETTPSPADTPVPEETLHSDSPSSVPSPPQPVDPDHPHPPPSEPHS